MNQLEISQYIKQEAKALGFLNCGISKARQLSEEADRLEKWLKDNKHGEMKYMENHFDKRLDPRLLLDDCKSVISLSYNYFPSKLQREDSYKISKYAYADDYHDIIRDKLNTFIDLLREKIGAFNAKAFVDSAPVLDKVWAKESGIGWIGKHSNLISKERGSFFFLAEILVDFNCAYDDPFVSDHCGTCTKCIDACPTDAIVQPYVVDGSKCISYYTIELKNDFPVNLSESFQGWIFGCDVCQDVCPWNRFSLPHQEKQFEIYDEIAQFSKKDWEELEEEKFKILFKKSAIKRTKYKGLKRNIAYNINRNN